MFAIEVEYLLGRAFAGDFKDRARSEWPPHPGRLFSALAAAYFENGADPLEKRALEWMEGQKPPDIHAGDAGEGETPMAFVPTNYPGDGPPVIRGSSRAFFPHRGRRRRWCISYGGTPIRMRRSPTRWTAGKPDGISGKGLLGGPYAGDGNSGTELCAGSGRRSGAAGSNKGRLQELAQLFEADQRVSPGAQQRYRRTDRRRRREGAIADRFRADGGVSKDGRARPAD